jgi:hypothetical protein
MHRQLCGDGRLPVSIRAERNKHSLQFRRMEAAPLREL